MENKKPWYKSKTIWSSIVGVVALAVGLLTDITITEQIQQDLVQQITTVIAAFSGLLAIVGRVVADSKISNEKE